MSDAIEQLGLSLIPEPQEIEAREGSPRHTRGLVLMLAPDAPDEDRFAAAYLTERLDAEVAREATGARTSVRITRGSDLPEQGYRLTISPEATLSEIVPIPHLRQPSHRAEHGSSCKAQSS